MAARNATHALMHHRTWSRWIGKWQQCSRKVMGLAHARPSGGKRCGVSWLLAGCQVDGTHVMHMPMLIVMHGAEEQLVVYVAPSRQSCSCAIMRRWVTSLHTPVQGNVTAA